MNGKHDLFFSYLETETGQRIADDDVIYDWRLSQPNGQRLASNNVAGSVEFDGPRLIITQVRLIKGAFLGSKGRCEVIHNGQLYTSPFFGLDFTPKYHEHIIEGRQLKRLPGSCQFSVW